MAESRQEGAPGAKQAERPSDESPRDLADDRNRGGNGPTAQRQAERLARTRPPGGTAGGRNFDGRGERCQRSGSAVADCAQEIRAAGARYGEEVVRHTSEASRALLRARTFNEMLEVQAKLLRDNMQAFLDQSARIAESASRMATRPLEALKEASSEQSRG